MVAYIAFGKNNAAWFKKSQVSKNFLERQIEFHHDLS
jgi:hypothetical protein